MEKHTLIHVIRVKEPENLTKTFNILSFYVLYVW